MTTLLEKQKRNFSVFENIQKHASNAIQESKNIAVFLKGICKKSLKFPFAKKSLLYDEIVHKVLQNCLDTE